MAVASTYFSTQKHTHVSWHEMLFPVLVGRQLVDPWLASLWFIH
jgi:hypothetical protein